tara:strand:+ start:355 stop:486 length:132 start_codon:yes stop_codon:yes gene_type:complete
MIKKIILVIILLSAVISCGKKGDPTYKNPVKDTKLKKILIKKI